MAQSTTETASIEREALARLSHDLNLLVVSLDRIGSFYADDPRGYQVALAEFLTEWKAFQRLAAARRVVDDALLGPNPTPEEEEALDHGEYWEPKG
jgi:hypothetical protein